MNTVNQEKVQKELQKKEIFKKSLVKKLTASIESIGIRIDSDAATWWANVAIACFVASCVLQAVTVYLAQTNEKLFECFSVLSFCIMGLLKLYSLRVYRLRWLRLTTLMTQLEINHTGNKTPDEEYESDDEGIDLRTYIEEYTVQFDSTMTVLTRVYNSTVVGFTLSPFIEYTYKKVTGDSPDYPHILPCWAPLDHLHVSGYILTVLMEWVAAYFCVALHLGFDRIAVGLMIFIKGQFLLLRRYCENIGGKGKKCTLSKRRDARAMYRIRYSQQLVVALGEIVGEFGKLLKNIMGLYYLEMTMTVCAVAMRLKTEILSVAQILRLLQYLGGTLFQLFLFCYYGDAVQDASAFVLGQGPSGSSYWGLSPRVRRNLAILSIGMMHPRRLCAGPFHYVDLPSFTMIVRAAYSYYAVLPKS